jgi:leucine dehydrogenase
MFKSSVFHYMRDHKIRRIRLKNSTAFMMRKDDSKWELLTLEKNPIYGFLLLTDLVLAQMGHEDFLIYYEDIPGCSFPLKAMICIYSMDLGPALAPLRVASYETEEDMVEDIAMISRAVARKASICGLGFGGAEIIVDYEKPRDVYSNHPSVFPMVEHVGRIVEEFQGQLIIGPDLHSSMKTMHIIQRSTSHVICNVDEAAFVPVESGNEESGSPYGSGDPTEFTAFGVYHSLKVATQFLEGSESLAGKKILIIGLGNVGLALTDHLIKEGADLYGADVNEASCRVMEEVYGMQIIARNWKECRNVHSFSCFAIMPCAGSGLISDKRLNDFQARVICGAANHQVNQDRDAVVLHNRNILYLPDFMVNCGGMINALQEVSIGRDGSQVYRQSYEEGAVRSKILEVKGLLSDILDQSKCEGICPHEVAVTRADHPIQEQRRFRLVSL